MPYLLACPQCGTKLVVSTGEAGGQVTCHCGEAVEVPTVRGLQALPLAPSEQVAEAAWTGRQAVLFLGAVITIAGLAFALFMHFRANETYPHIDFPHEIRRLPPEASWRLWSEYLRHGIGKWQPEKGVQQQADLKKYAELKQWEWIGFGLAGAGAIVAAISVAMLGRPRPATPGPPRRSTTTIQRK